ncbi:MAG: hypothetical protein COV47_05230 [Candidatus Diapherotrites archaeon CG11_big_fil_rev_8_21_14_0_20_37_9]|nr:MAG: hypothetical protein COV47_05230 [Candidatus Diapherotrites archaeon CG11_big_fil_rev_8_21_14_0_20_37_9]
MAKRKAEENAEILPEKEDLRPISGEEARVEETDAGEEDIFEQVLTGKKAKVLREAIEKNEEELLGDDEEPDSEEDEEDSEEDNEETEKDEEEPEEEVAEETDDAEVKEKEADEEPKEETVESEETEEDADKESPEEDSESEDKGEGEEDEEGEEESGEETKSKDEESDEEETDENEEEEADPDVDADAKEPVDGEIIDDEQSEDDSPKGPGKAEIKKTILEKAAMATGEIPVAERLNFLTDDTGKSVFIGRKASIYKKFGFEAALQVGKVQENEFQDASVYLDSMNPHAIFVCGARGSGKCLTGDTLITIENGEMIPIKELETRNEKIFALNSQLKIGKTPRTQFFKRTVEKTIKLTMGSGKEIELTPEHPLLTINGWKPAEELKTGFRIATPRVLPAFGNSNMKNCDVKLLAYLIAEGHLSNEFVLFSNKDKRIVDDFKASVYEFDDNLRIEYHSSEICYRVAQKKKEIDISNVSRNKKGQFTDKGFIVAQKSALMKWLESIGIYGKLSANKFVPKEIMQLNKEQLALFLNRLFSCDGTIHRINKGKNWSVSIGFSSEELTRQVQHLLLRFGITSRFRKKISKLNGKEFRNFETVLYSENVLKFIAEIGFYGEKEKRMVKAAEEMILQKRNPNIDTIPKEIWKIFPVENWEKMAREFGYAPQSFHNTRNYAPSREKLLKMAQFEANKGIQLLAESDIFWDTIKEIKEINRKTEVYDISVPEYHNFVANDIIVHNSYVLGVIAEELAEKNRNVGIVVVDPIGVFWSMKYPNKEEKEIEMLTAVGLKPKGLNNLKVFIPEGIKSQVPKTTYDAGFSLQPSLLTGEDWALTFGIDRFSVSGLLLEKALKKVEKGYKQSETNKKFPGKGKNYSIDDLIRCLETDSELNSREKGYKQDSIRAIVSRFEAAKNWGIFHEKGTPLGELSRQGQLTILDTSFLEDNVTALVIGILSRRLLSARKICTRKEAANKFKELSVNELLELEVPPTWLFIDEAHTLIPSGNEITPATAGLIEYVKQGRRPGLSLVFATQQPSAINTKVLSQIDVIMTHKLIFDDDIKAVFKRTPTIIPKKYRASNFIKTLPVGVALTGDRREETSRAFVMGIRPRKSQHEGRDAETTNMSDTLDKEKVESMAIEMLARGIKADGFMDLERIEMAIGSLNNKYNSEADVSVVLAGLKARGLVVVKDKVASPDYNAEMATEELTEDEKEEGEENGESGEQGEEEEAGEETEAGGESGEESEGEEEADEETYEGEQSATELTALPARVNEEYARRVVNRVRKKKLFGLLGSSERIESIQVKYMPIWRIKFDAMSRGKEFISRECYVNSLTCELIHFKNGDFIESKGLEHFLGASEEEALILKALQRKEMVLDEIIVQAGIDEGKALRLVNKLIEKGLLGKIVDSKHDRTAYFLKEKIDLPPSERHELLGSLSMLPFVRAQALNVEKETFSKEDAAEALKKLWRGIIVKKIEQIYKPVWKIVLSEDAKERIVLIDAVNGKVISA